MITFVIGLLILIGGGMLYGRHCEKVFGPDDRECPAVTKADGVDFMVLKEWKNSLINLLNIAGTGPILGAIQGILFGPVAFITIPIGNVLAGSMHDYFSGMISMRNGGMQMPGLIRQYMGKSVFRVYNVVVIIMMVLVGAVFTYTPGDLIVSELLGQKAVVGNPTTWIVYAFIFLYYLAATVFPIDKIIGRIYPVFGFFLVISAFGILSGVFLDGGAHLSNLSFQGLLGQHPDGLHFIPVFFITVACGIMSGFHATQNTLIARTVKSEKEGRMTFYNMMTVEGLITMAWAGGAMVLFGKGTPISTNATLMVGIVSRDFLGNFGGILAIIGVIVLPITTGDTAMRGLRLIMTELIGMKDNSSAKRLGLSFILFIPVAAILYFAKTSPSGFSILWRYFAFTNQFMGIFALATISTYLFSLGKNGWISLLPGAFYTFITISFISNAKIGLGLPWPVAYSIAIACAVAYMLCIRKRAINKRDLK